MHQDNSGIAANPRRLAQRTVYLNLELAPLLFIAVQVVAPAIIKRNRVRVAKLFP